MAGNGYIKNSDGSYSVNYDDQRFIDVKNEQVQKEAELNNTYNNMINESDKYYDNQIQATKDYATQQSELQQANTNFAIQQIEQQKEQMQEDYTKEQKGAYVDYLKQTKSNAQSMANSGLSNTGYSESSLVSIYNAYQNRVASAKDSLNRNILNYNNSITQAQLANNERLAEIAYNALQMQNNLSREAFEYKNTLILQKESELQKVNEIYYARYQDVLSEINNEISLKMQLDKIDREYDQWLQEFNEKHNQWQSEMALKEKQLNEEIRHNKAQESLSERQLAETIKNNNPYTGGNTSKLGNTAQKLLSDMKNAKNNNGKGYSNWKGIDSINATILTYQRSNKITDSEAEELFNYFNN